MAYKSYLRYVQTGEVYVKTWTTSAAGQRVATFTLSETIPMHFQSPSTQTTGGDRRLAPYVENIAVYEAIIPGMYENLIDYDNRIQNVKDRYGNVVEAGPFEIVAIQPKFGWGGKKHHVVAIVRRVVEQQ